MLSIAENVWQVFSLLIILTMGLTICVLQFRWLRIGRANALIFFIWHTAFSAIYFRYSLSFNADATLYYLNSLDPDVTFDLGTKAINYLTSFLSVTFGLSYAGSFLFFSYFGFIGMLAFASSLQEMTRESSRFVKRSWILIIMLPSLSFWSSAIGKDALSFFAAGLAVWGSLRFSKRYPALLLALIALTLARPHMAAVFLASLTFAAILSTNAGVVKRTLAILIIVPISVFGLQIAIEYVGLNDASSTSDIAEYIEARQGFNTEGGSSIDIASMSAPMRIFAYIFRPLFIDANGVLGLALSIDNLILLSVAVFAGYKILMRRKSSLPSSSYLFNISFFVLSVLILANTTANLGIASRQKWMFMPMFLALCYSYIARKRVVRSEVKGSPIP